MTRSQQRRLLFLPTAVACLSLGAGTAPALAQDANTNARIGKIEAEVRALQRKVFPGADGKYFTPEIAPGAPTPTPGLPPASSALSDVLTRLDALEGQLARLTGQVEQNTNRIVQLEARLAASSPLPATPAAPTTQGTFAPAPGGAALQQAATLPTTSQPAAGVPAAAQPAPAKVAAPPSRVQASVCGRRSSTPRRSSS